MIEVDGSATPRNFAGRSMLRPYEEKTTPQRRWMGRAAPSMSAGHGMPCPYETT